MKWRRVLEWIPMYVFALALVLGLTWAGSEAVTVVAEKLPVPRQHCFIIDAGHGGEDGGAVSCTGVYESAINLEIALRLDDLLHLLGYDTRMIRTTDTAIYTQGQTLAQKKVSDLKQRVKIVNETDGAILVSIHQNQFSDSRYSGVQVLYSKQGKALANAVQNAFQIHLNDGSRRQPKYGEGIYLLTHIEQPGVLVECGFLSNYEEEGKLRSPDYQQKICCVIAGTLAEFCSNT